MVASTSISGASDVDQPVRTLIVRIHVSQNAFVGSDNVITLFEGNKTVSTFELRAPDSVQQNLGCVQSSPYTQTQTYQQVYGSSLALLGSGSCLYEVSILSNQAYLTFLSRDTSYAHFVSTYSYAFTCPSGMELDTTSNECIQPSTSSVSVVAVVLPMIVAMVALLFCLLLRERYVRQREKANDRRRTLSTREQRSSLYVRDFEHEHKRKQLYSLLQVICLFSVEVTVVCLNWATAGADIRSSQSASSLSSLTLAFITLVVISSMCMLINGASRAITVLALWREIQASRESMDMKTFLEHNKQTSLSEVDRDILRIKIASLSLIFDSVPFAILNFIRVLSTCGPLQLVSFAASCFLIGSKITLMLDLPRLRGLRVKALYNIWLDTNERTHGKEAIEAQAAARASNAAQSEGKSTADSWIKQRCFSFLSFCFYYCSY